MIPVTGGKWHTLKFGDAISQNQSAAAVEAAAAAAPAAVGLGCLFAQLSLPAIRVNNSGLPPSPPLLLQSMIH